MKNHFNGKKGASPFTFTHVALILLCAVLVTGYLLGNGLYARYSSSASGSASARVASFGAVTVADDPDNCLTLLPGVSGKRQSYVSFAGAEVKTYVFVVITAPENWEYDAEKHQLTAAGGNITLGISTDNWACQTSNKNILVLCYKEALAPDDTLTDVAIFADEGTITVKNETTATQLTEAAGTFTVQAVAVQGNGFADAVAAWDSLSKKFST